MTKKSDKQSATRKPGPRQFPKGKRELGTAEAPRSTGARDVEGQIYWLQSDMEGLGHGVQFLHDAVGYTYAIAFLEGFDWLHQPGGTATVRLRRTRPASIAPEEWAMIIQSAREAVQEFLEQSKLDGSFRHGPVQVLFNA